jgi:hypothetical protein
MAILFVGSTPTELGGFTTENTTLFGRDADFTPIGSKVSGDMDEYGIGFAINHATPAAVTWYHFLFSTTQSTNYNVYPDGWWFRIYSGTTIIAEVDVLNGNYTLQGGGQTSPTFTPWASNVNMTYDVKVEADGTDITVEFYQNGVLTTSITYASALKPDSISFDHYDLVWNTGSHDYRYSEVIITDNEPTLGWRLATLEPAAFGTHTAWAGNIAALASIGDGNSISSEVVGDKQSWTLSAYNGPATTSGVRAVVNKYIGNTGPSGPGNLIPFIRDNAVDVDSAAYTPDGTLHMEVLDNNPETTVGWDTADLATLEIGIKSET